MNIDEFMGDFEIHAKSELFNGDEISGEVLDEIQKQLTDAVGAKNPPRWAVMEFAMYRVKKMLKITVSEDEWLLFEKALKAGYITEDKLNEVKEQVNIIQANFERIGYIIYLLELPNRASKQSKWKKQNSNLVEHFAEASANEEAIFAENKSALDHLRAELKKLEKESKKE